MTNLYDQDKNVDRSNAFKMEPSDWVAPSSLPKVYETYDFISPSRFKGKLKGKVAIITGASVSLGRYACIAFAAAGASVACVARREEHLKTLVEEINSKDGGRAIAIPADVAEPSAAKKIVEATEKELGPVDVLVNNAGINRIGALSDEENIEFWWRVMEVNVRGPVALTHAVLPSMIERNAGIIIGVASLGGVLDIPLMTPYAASKAALIKFQQNLALEASRHGILSFSIHPGAIQTEMGTRDGAANPAAMKDPIAQDMVQSFMQLKFQSMELMGDTCVAICADERCKVLNGRFIDCENPLDKIVEDAENPDGEFKKRDLHRLKVDEL